MHVPRLFGSIKVLWLLAVAGGVLSFAPGPTVRAADESHPPAESASHGSTAAGGGAHGAADTHAAGGHGHVGDPTGKDAKNVAEFKSDLAIWTFCVFLLLLAILTKFAWKPIAEGLERREHAIAENIAAAQRSADDARTMLAEYEKKLAGAADDVRAMLEEARRDAETAKAEIITEAKQSAQAEHDRAMRDVRNATDAALKQLSERGADLAIQLAGKLMRRKLSAEDHAGLVHEALNGFEKSNVGVN